MQRVLWSILMGGVAMLIGSPAAAQNATPLTIEAIYGGQLSSSGPSRIQWQPGAGGSRGLSFFLSADGGGRDLWLQDLESGERQRLVGAELLREIGPSPSQASNEERERTRRNRFGVADYRWAPDGESILFASAGKVILYNLASASTTHLAPQKDGVLDPRFSPDGKFVAFVYEHDLWIVATDEGADARERQVTFGGNENLLHGELDWVYPEELGVRAGYHWSPDSRRIAFLEMDESTVPVYAITEEVSYQASFDLQRYPKPGDPNPRVRVGIVDVYYETTAWIDRAAEYIPRIQWRDESMVTVQLFNRGQDELELIGVDPKTGRSTSLYTQTDPYWLHVTDDLTFLDGGEQFLWTSETTGFRHIYLHGQDGAVVRALTKGEWQVDSIVGVDEPEAIVYFEANRDNPIGRDLYRVGLDGSGLECLTDGQGTHTIDMNPSATYYLDRFSSMTDPGNTTLHNLDDDSVTMFSETKSLADYGLVTPETTFVDAPDGAKVSVLVMKPTRLEPGKRYPVLVYVYGMPGVPTIRDSWAGNRYLFHQFLVQNGYIVAQIDDRSSAIWGHKYAVLGDHDIGPVAVKDHALGVEYLESLPYVDPDRIAVWGWSGGGFTTTFHMTHTDLFQVGIAGAPVTDWHLYDSIYTERYMGTPQEDPEAYERTSSVKAAKDYRGRLLIIHGTHDDNVHPQNTTALIDGLIKNRKQFDMMLYPNKTHGISGSDETIHLWTMVYDYLERNLKN